MSQSPPETDTSLRIRPIRRECSTNVYTELCEAIEHVGGVKCQDGFAFVSEDSWRFAVEWLGDRFGHRYFEVSRQRR
jgi:hypothetical protein